MVKFKIFYKVMLNNFLKSFFEMRSCRLLKYFFEGSLF